MEKSTQYQTLSWDQWRILFNRLPTQITVAAQRKCVDEELAENPEFWEGQGISSSDTAGFCYFKFNYPVKEGKYFRLPTKEEFSQRVIDYVLGR